MNTQSPHLSIVTSLYRSSPFVEEFLRRAVICASSLGFTYELVVVNDGSPDDSLEKAEKILEELGVAYQLIDFSRNFGHHEAFVCGMEHSRGEFIFLIDSDLEEAPELLREFYEVYRSEAQVDVVFGIQNSRKGGLFERLSGKIFYRIFNALSDVKIPENPSTVRLLSRRYVDALKAYSERRLFLAGLYEHVGFKKRSVVLNKEKRHGSNYSLVRKLRLFALSITGFSKRPLYILALAGLIFTCISLLLTVLLVFRYLVYGISVEGWTSLIVINIFFFGLTSLSMGLVGIYIAHLFEEVKARPRYVIRSQKSSDGHPTI